MLLLIDVEGGYKKYFSLVCRDLHGNNSWYIFKKTIWLEEQLTLYFFFSDDWKKTLANYNFEICAPSNFN